MESVDKGELCNSVKGHRKVTTIDVKVGVVKEDILQICRQKGESFKDCLLDTIGVQESTSDTKMQVFLKTNKKTILF